jgi:membrane associated rhomboid family serine protease
VSSSSDRTLEVLRPVRFIILLATIVSATSIILFYALDRQTQFDLILTEDFFWGIVTAIFIHKDSTHLLSNVAAIMTATFLTGAAIHMSLLPRSRSRLFITTTLIMAMVTNALWIAIIISLDRAAGTSGASGLVYAFMGSAAAFFVTNTTDALTLYRANQIPRKKSKLALVRNALTTAIFLVLIVLFRDQFLGIADGVNIFSHAIGFGGAFLITMGREMMASRKYSYQSPEGQPS